MERSGRMIGIPFGICGGGCKGTRTSPTRVPESPQVMARAVPTDSGSGCTRITYVHDFFLTSGILCAIIGTPERRGKVISSYDALRAQVDADGGLYTTTMEELREIEGAGRLGQHVRNSISGSLAANGMGHLPAELPAYQESSVRVYRLGTALADVINAVQKPSSPGDQILRQVGTSDAQDVIKKIRQLVCD